jgi:hypothetical protein
MITGLLLRNAGHKYMFLPTFYFPQEWVECYAREAYGEHRLEICYADRFAVVGYLLL